MQSQGPIRLRLVRIERAHRAFVRRLAEQVFAPWGAGYGARVAELGYTDGVDTLVGLMGPEPVGFVQVSAAAGVGEIYAVAVAPTWRRRGLGRVLLEAGVARLTDAGAASITLHVATDNRAARGLFESAGFAAHSTDQDEDIRYPGGAQALCLRRPRTGASPATREEIA